VTTSNIFTEQADGDVEAKYDLIAEAFGTVQGFLQQLKLHLSHRIDSNLSDYAVKILAQILVFCASVNKVISEGRFSECHHISTISSTSIDYCQ
jgi:hypothetical protein